MYTRFTPSKAIFRRRLLLLSAAAVGTIVFLKNAQAQTVLPLVTVWKTPTCGCCKLWVEHLEKEGFTVRTNDVAQTAPVRDRLGIPNTMGSCHTGWVAGFAIEGHVPATEIKRLLAEPQSLREQVIGLAVPGMPVGSPGMEMGSKRDKFDVMLVLKGGVGRVYQSYNPQS
jgi:hypothetical protein